MRDLKAELKLLKTCNTLTLSSLKYSGIFAKEIMQRAIAAEAEAERLRGQVEKMKNCMNCQYCNDWLECCVNKKDCIDGNFLQWELKGAE